MRARGAVDRGLCGCRSVCASVRPARVSGGWPSGGRGRGRCGRAAGRRGSTERGRRAAGSGRAGAASRRSRRAGGPARSLGWGGRLGLSRPPSCPVLAAAILGSAMPPAPVLPPLPVTALSCCPGPRWLRRRSAPGPDVSQLQRRARGSRQLLQAAGGGSQPHSCRQLRTSGGPVHSATKASEEGAREVAGCWVLLATRHNRS